MDWKLEGSAQKTDSQVLQEQEVILEDTGEDSISESFQLLQIDVECEHREGDMLPTGGTVWCSKNVQRKQRHWEKIVAAKKSKRKQEKERRKANRVENSGICPQHSKRFLRSLTKERLLEAKHSGPRLCIDLSMTHHMSKKEGFHPRVLGMAEEYTFDIGQELSRLAGQIRRLYGSNKKASRTFWIYLTGFTTDSPLYEECLRMNDGFSSYLLDITEEDCFSLFPLDTLVYLTPDSEHALEDIDLNKVYILGGLVDESIQKKVTFQKAREHSVKTARLPIQEYMVRHQNGKNYHSEILAINQVFDILSTYFETQNWPEALKKGVSSRKGYVLQNSVDDGQPEKLPEAKLLEVS
ncbi:tRNA methyltransferase 10 homolog B isoform X1 [Lontra canadensis]|uniref:tRNA methyltransferase 10 homolog B isoform X1 n=1 Tax=Lontra canadensis TaxID=76717 RepID=UPI0013F35A0A|nr:tRNA methyltransferase 10 homolog B isoform X1 [Lontra canadensis]XP_032716516.1 tRNA methyltransferase 10 homolog B isoform X1 [Lontra canadensis]XP_032716517.1 tRNA methyltransferase 10 homolog B isoform X1 [Lontra canadensis]XP_032716518.1 tRNA methyltransferase 10 homolog B isoform X1 [Lontra canadensis]XP_032716520.1 tRNA methyltransferase 10 homolog B isoform X1 [Lontra canadensis]XP_032716521.1 tRNA methyltransferase 10 homolog B isoform X1 [Lontra canadensis]XP_032716522.1 tRNA met